MNRFSFWIKSNLLLAGFLLLANSCSETPLIYTHPDWLGGTNIETLEKEGDCTIFLELMDKAGYREAIERQLFVLFVPRDSAFREYFNKTGINSLEDLSKEEAFRLFTMYVLPDPLSRYQLIYENAWEQESPEGEYGALFFRKKTRSQIPAYFETPEYDLIYAGRELKIQMRNKPVFLPFITTEYMEDYFVTPHGSSYDGSDYTFLCRESKWSGTQWHDAMVTDAEVRTANGFIYYLDRVIVQPPTVDKYLRDNPERYGIFYDMIQPFAMYKRWVNEYDEEVFEKTYSEKVYDIANPEGPSAGGGLHSQLDMFTLFMPGNEAWENYFASNNIQDYKELSEITRIYLIQTHISKKLAFKSKIDKGMGSTFGDILEIDTDVDITGSFLCNNAAVYDLNKVVEPFIFKTVTGPIFLDRNYSTFLIALYLSGKMNMVSSRDFDVTVFPMTNEQCDSLGIRYNEFDNKIEFLTSQQKWVAFDQRPLEKFVNGYIVKDKLSDLTGEGFIELVSGEYMYFNDNRLYGAGNFEVMDNPLIVGSVENEINGILYYLDTPLKASKTTAAGRILNDPAISEFYNLMLQAGVVTVTQDPKTFDIVHKIPFIQSDNDWTIFVPTNAALIEARDNGDIPGDPDLLKKFIYNHFIKDNVIFDDGQKSGTFNTSYQTGVSSGGAEYAQIIVDNSWKNMVLTDPTGETIPVLHTMANVLVESGVMHKINKVLKMPNLE